MAQEVQTFVDEIIGKKNKSWATNLEKIMKKNALKKEAVMREEKTFPKKVVDPIRNAELLETQDVILAQQLTAFEFDLYS